VWCLAIGFAAATPLLAQRLTPSRESQPIDWGQRSVQGARSFSIPGEPFGCVAPASEKRLVTISIAPAVVSERTDAAQAVPDQKMTAAERAEIIELLQQSERELMQAIDGLNDQQWAYKPGPDRWSVAEVMEHIVLADALLFETAVKSLDAAANVKWETTLSKTDLIRRAIPDRSRKVDAPAAIRPKEAMSRAQLLARFKEQRSRVSAYVRDTDKPLKAHTSANPFFGDLNAHQWLIYIPLHHLRHNQQILEVKASPGYPR
jgi:hypothetical protein